MSTDNLSTSPSSPATDFADEDILADKNREAVQSLELQKKLLEIQIRNLQAVVNDELTESFSRDQLPAVKNELEQTCNEKYQQRTKELMFKLSKAQTEKNKLESIAANLKKRLQDEQRITAQLIQERENLRPQKFPEFPELSLPDMQILRDACGLVHKKRVLEDEVREAERQLSLRRQDIAENEANLIKMIQESKATTSQCEIQLRQETLDLAQLEEMRASLKERLETSIQRQKQLEKEKVSLMGQIEAAEASQRARMEEFNRNFLAAQREFEEEKAKKEEEIRILTKQLRENEELFQSKVQEKDKLTMELNSIVASKQAMSQSVQMTTKSEMKPIPKEKIKKITKNEIQKSNDNIVKLQAEVADLQKEKKELMKKMEELNRKASSNEAKLDAIKRKLEKQVADSEKKIRQLGYMNDDRSGSLPPPITVSDSNL